MIIEEKSLLVALQDLKQNIEECLYIIIFWLKIFGRNFGRSNKETDPLENCTYDNIFFDIKHLLHAGNMFLLLI